MFSDRYVLLLLFSKNSQIGKHLATTKAREKISTDLESLELYIFFEVCLTKFKKSIKVYTLKLATDFH
jgi:hypothetical protein